jgi:integrase
MADYVFESRIGAHIKAFVEQKRSCGFPYESSARILHHFDLMVADRFPDADTVTKEICDAWLHQKPTEHPNGLLRRVTPVRQLAKYMRGSGASAYVISSHIPNKQVKYEAHIYTEVELRAFFRSVDQCLPSPFSPTRRYVIPVLFRLIYCCGLRPSEARLLQAKDVDLDTGKLVIRESKGWKARIVYMSDDLLEVCKEYSTIMGDMLPGREAFFPNREGVAFSRSTIDTWFHEFWDCLPEAEAATGNTARVHDFRHAFLVNRLNLWVREDRDVNALYPYLSEYVGHAHYADTDYYLSLVESFYPEMEKRLCKVNDDILPEVCHEDQ